MTKSQFQKIIYKYYEDHGRTLPWRNTEDPYKILVSELMLQQTQVDRVIPKYEAFIKAFPTAQDLAKASVAEVLSLWSGLGYNRRALFLQKAAQAVGSTFPSDQESLESLPGIGPYTASAIRAFAFNLPSACIETNIRRVFLYFFFKDQEKVTDTQLFVYINKMLDTKNPREWYWALMDYGSQLKGLVVNPNTRSKHYTKQSKFQGSDRQVRGEILKFLVAEKKPVTQALILKSVLRPKAKVLEKIIELTEEGFIRTVGGKIMI